MIDSLDIVDVDDIDKVKFDWVTEDEYDDREVEEVPLCSGYEFTPEPDGSWYTFKQTDLIEVNFPK
jgi:hypothetical protein